MNSHLAKKIRIGDILVDQGVITQSQLECALKEHEATGLKLGKTLIQLGFVTESRLLEMLSQQLDIDFIDIKTFNYQREDVRLLKETIARRFRVAVLKKTDKCVVLGMSDPTDIFCLDEVSKHFKMPIEPVVVKESELLEVLDNSYGQSEKIASLAEEINEDLGDIVDIGSIVDDEDDAPVARLLQKIFEEAVKYNASDIHIEPDKSVLRIRQRIDGVLSEQVLNEKRVAAAVVVKIKLMSGLDISEKRIPQDGRFNLKINKKNIDVRISTMPVQHGESVVMRLLVVDDGVKTLEQVGIPKNIIADLRKVVRKPHGLVLVTGPTGSGKTTTLYAALSELNSADKKIITVEDPVEYQLPRLSQVQVNEKVGLNFSEVLKATLRQDPDILLVGEIRDVESADIALKASMTGHLVLSTLHTNDAISSALRLMDMGVDPFLVATAVKAVVAQRLVRKLCNVCKEDMPQSELKKYSHLLSKKEQGATFKHAPGCVNCLNTGYKGRLGVFEYMEVTEDMASDLRKKDIEQFTHKALVSPNYMTLKESAMALAIAGETSLAELQRITL